jgi:hypothetical protein
MQKTNAANEITADEQISGEENSYAIDGQAGRGKNSYKNQSNGSKIAKTIATHGLAAGASALI